MPLSWLQLSDVGLPHSRAFRKRRMRRVMQLLCLLLLCGLGSASAATPGALPNLSGTVAQAP